MKVVLFCGGLGTRMRSAAQSLPKPLVRIGEVPLIECVMRYYAHYGHNEFILCLGYGAQDIYDYFRQLDGQFMPTISNGAQTILVNHRNGQNWNVTLVDTGMDTSIGQRLRLVERYVAGEEMFLANYSDGLTDLHLPDIIDDLVSRPSVVAALVAVKPIQSFHFIDSTADGLVTGIAASADIKLRINGGFFVFRQEIFRHLNEEEDLLDGLFTRLAPQHKLLAHPHDGFWRACDTMKDVQLLETILATGGAPWEVWRGNGFLASTGGQAGMTPIAAGA